MTPGRVGSWEVSNFCENISADASEKGEAWALWRVRSLECCHWGVPGPLLTGQALTTPHPGGSASSHEVTGSVRVGVLPCPAQVARDKLLDRWDDGDDGNDTTPHENIQGHSLGCPFIPIQSTFCSSLPRALSSLFYSNVPQAPGSWLMSMYTNSTIQTFLKPSQDITVQTVNPESPSVSTHSILGAVLGFFNVILSMTLVDPQYNASE